MTKPVKTLTLEFFRAGDVMPDKDRTLIINHHDGGYFLSKGIDPICSILRQVPKWEPIYGARENYKYFVSSDDFWAYWPEKELEDE